MTYSLTVAGLKRNLPLCPISPTLTIASFVLLGDARMAEEAARELLKKVPGEYDYIMTAESKGIPLAHEMARQARHSGYVLARKSIKTYMNDPLGVEVNSITTQNVQRLYLAREDVELIRGKRVLLVDDVISTGESIAALEQLAAKAGAAVAGRMAILAEGDAQKRDDIVFLEGLPLFHPDGTVMED